MLEVEMLMCITQMLDGTNFSSIKEDTSSMKEAQYLKFKVDLTIKTDKLSEQVRMAISNNNGTSCMLTKPERYHPQATAPSGDYGSIDHLILSHKCQEEDTLISSITMLLSRYQTALIHNLGTLITNQELSSLKLKNQNLLI